MAESAEFCIAQARAAEAAAETASLANVKARSLQAAAVWRSMAERAARVAAQRQQTEEEKRIQRGAAGRD